MRLFFLPGNESFANRLGRGGRFDLGALTARRFPDGEWYLRLAERVDGESCALVATLDRPDEKILPVVFAARLLREHGARHVGLVAPYLCYLRQDRRFRDGESITSREFAGLLASEIDWLVTAEPHLHRYRSLGEIYTIPTKVADAAGPIADWIRQHVRQPLLIGPDVESEPWIFRIAMRLEAPSCILAKERHGDRSVSIVASEGFEPLADHTPVIVDDVISTGRTQAAAVELLRGRGALPPYCVAVHGVFAADAEEALRRSGARAVVTTNTIANPTAEIDVSDAIAAAVLSIGNRERGATGSKA